MTSKKRLILFFAFFLTACVGTGTVLTHEGAKVRFVDNKPGASCKFIAKAEGRRGTFFSGRKTHTDLLRDAAHELQNKAAKLGGNVIFNSQKTRSTIVSQLVPTDVVIEGDVYRCPTAKKKL